MEEIQKHKWIESEKKGEDLGDKAIVAWIKAHSMNFRFEYGYLTRLKH